MLDGMSNNITVRVGFASAHTEGTPVRPVRDLALDAHRLAVLSIVLTLILGIGLPLGLVAGWEYGAALSVVSVIVFAFAANRRRLRTALADALDLIVPR
jgi:Flp pilus assembly protein TadB